MTKVEQALRFIARNILHWTRLHKPLVSYLEYRQKLKNLREWELSGRPVPPPHMVKQRIIKEYKRRFRIVSFIETGTYMGDMVNAVKNDFDRIISIELDHNLYEKAKDRFKKYAHITIMEGDSGEVLAGLVGELEKECLFWLDGHYSGGITAKGKLDTPIIKELENLFKDSSRDDVIMIDDARCFVGENNYPTIDALREFVLEKRGDSIFEVEDDIIRIHKRPTGG